MHASGWPREREIEKLGLVADAVATQPDVPTVDLDLPRIAVFDLVQHGKVGWVRLAFDPIRDSLRPHSTGSRPGRSASREPTSS